MPNASDLLYAAPRHLFRTSERVWHSFPVQLMVLQLRQNHLLLILWVLLVLFISDRLAAKFGVKYLFLEPEYAGQVGGLSFFLVGVGLGGMIMTWNLTTYLLNARYFPFLATLARPFGKYCINNALLPLGFFGFYVLRLRAFLKAELDYGNGQLLGAGLSLLAGVLLVVVVYFLYFRFTNKDIASYPDLRDLLRGQARRRRKRLITGHRGVSLAQLISGENAWRVDHYLTESLTPRRTRSIAHYKPDQILGVFRQNHLNALLLQGAILLILVLSGLGMDFAWVRIPAGASIFILFSVIAAVAGAVTYWFHAWRTSIFVLALVLINLVTGQDWFTFRNRAYGLDYSGELPAYSYQRLEELADPVGVARDRDSMRLILERWRARTGEDKPRMILLCVSGGGLKATYWTTHVLQEVQAATGGAFLRHTTLISGASGGMIGAAYVRDLTWAAGVEREGVGSAAGQPEAVPVVLRTRDPVPAQPSVSNASASRAGDVSVGEAEQSSGRTSGGAQSSGRASGGAQSNGAAVGGFRQNPVRDVSFRQNRWSELDLQRDAEQYARALAERHETLVDRRTADSIHLEAAGRDLLNSVAFAIVSRDLFLPSSHFTLDGKRYRKDRAYAFEQQLNENLGGIFRKRLGDYEAAERAAEIPMLLLTPSIVNDARRLIISPLGVRHMTLPPAGVGRGDDFEVDAVDFGALFADRLPGRLPISTALRMNATYPYVLPNVYLPSSPPVEVMDAGFRDNFGVMEASRFLQVYREWILEHTSGVTLVQVSTLEKFERPKERKPRGWISSLFSPLGVAGQLISLQDFQLDDNIGLLHELFGEDYFEFVRFSYRPAEDREAAAMTFHLTEGEKADIRASIRHPDNVRAMGMVKGAVGGHEGH